MKKLFLDFIFATLCAALLAACGGDSGSSADSLDESSSSVEMDVSSASVPGGSSDDDGVSSASDGSSSDSEGGESSGSGEGSSASVPGGSSDASVYDTDKNTLTDLRDGQTYKTVKIGGQVWMAENLNFETDNSWCGGGSGTTEGDCSVYGHLYTWASAMDSVGTWSMSGKGCGWLMTCSPTYPVRGVCPKGWHLPSKEEWEALIVAVDGSITEYEEDNMAGTKLKSKTGWNAHSGVTNEDAFEFSALPAGDRGYEGDFDDVGIYAYFWSSTEVDSENANFMYLYYGHGKGFLNDYSKDDGFSVRCLMD